MGRYTIKDLEKLSGIKAHTLRIWEQRYNIITPKRTETNIRYYDNEHLKRILNIAFLNKKGVKISKIASMPNDEICQKVLELSHEESGHNNFVNTLLIALVDMDEDLFEKTINGCVLRLGFESCMVKIIYPFLRQIGIMWQSGAILPAQEHFMSNLIRQKIIVAIDGHPNPKTQQNDSYMLFCPEGELHEINLLFSAYLLKISGKRIIYLGVCVPFEDLERVYNMHKPENMIVSISTFPDKYNLQAYIDKLSKQFKQLQIIFTGYIFETESPDLPKNATIIKDISQFKTLIKN